jgi:hypothetical protein
LPNSSSLDADKQIKNKVFFQFGDHLEGIESTHAAVEGSVSWVLSFGKHA